MIALTPVPQAEGEDVTKNPRTKVEDRHEERRLGDEVKTHETAGIRGDDDACRGIAGRNSAHLVPQRPKWNLVCHV